MDLAAICLIVSEDEAPPTAMKLGNEGVPVTSAVTSRAQLPFGSGCRGYVSDLYSSEKRVSSVLLWIHLNSSGQLPSAMQVSTTLLRSRLSWLRAGSVLKYGGTSSAKSTQSGYFSPGHSSRLINDATAQSSRDDHCKYRTHELAGWKI